MTNGPTTPPVLKTLPDALQIRRRILEAFELGGDAHRPGGAEGADDLRRRRWRADRRRTDRLAGGTRARDT